MKEVTIYFHNIQSHADTKFQLKPGLNFILADDNNVGKSTIFKVLTTVARMPNITNIENQELLRAKCSEGYASFVFDDKRVTYWIFREGSKGEKIHSFFEYITDNGETIRTVICPSVLLDALDIFVSENKQVLNFNDADSVQLVVQDNNKNDEIFGKILIDENVELLKERSSMLGKEIIQDYKNIKNKYDDTCKTLSSLSFNTSVSSYFDIEKELMSSARILDLLLSVDLEAYFSHDYNIILDRLSFLNSLYDLLIGINDINVSSIIDKYVEVFEYRNIFSYYSVLSDLEIVLNEGQYFIQFPKEQNIDDCNAVLKFLNIVDNLLRCVVDLVNSVNYCKKLEIEYKNILDIISKTDNIVRCPVKGEVFYNGKNCIPINN